MALPSIVRWPLRAGVTGLSLAGAAGLALAAMIATPTRYPPPLASISAGAQKIATDGLPELKFMQARDQTFLAYRVYEPLSSGDGRIAVLAHGSSAQSGEMHVVGRSLAEAGFRAIALDIRGHGHSGTRGDIAYLGQLDDDLADMVKHIRNSWPDAPLTLIGHSAGGGFALRTAGGPNGDLFASYILLAPFLGPRAPSSRPEVGSAHWAEPNLPRIFAIKILESFGITCCNGLPTIAYALHERALPFTTRQYSYRLLANYGTVFDYKSALMAAQKPITVIAGADDELMFSDRYAEAMLRQGLEVKTVVLPGIDHMGIVSEPAALKAIVAAVKGEARVIDGGLKRSRAGLGCVRTRGN